MIDRKYLVIGLVIVLVLGLGCIENKSPQTQKTDNVPTENIQPKSEKSISIVNSATKTYSIGDSEAPKGKIFLVITLDINNNGYDKFSNNLLYWELEVNKKKYNYIYQTDSLDDKLETTEILNGGTSKGSIAFEVPEDVTNYTIYYTGFEKYSIDWKSGGWIDNAKSRIVNIDYTSRKTKSIGYSEPQSGKVFLIVTFKIENKGYHKFSTNPYYFKMLSNNIEYDYASSTYNLDDKLEDIQLLDGGITQGSVAFEVPSTVEDFEIKYTGNDYNIIYKKG